MRVQLLIPLQVTTFLRFHLVIVLHCVNAIAGRSVADPSVREDVLRRVYDKLLRVDVVEEPLERLAIALAPEVQPVREVADVDRLKVGTVHVEEPLVSGIRIFMLKTLQLT